ncbi:hypothetical protein BC936DRAFT_144162 [Jimgerdemannia flammicorona]|uniref:Uncharacterized protein n=1 Tax=Jimgerdemannia flammicorona TaxID=994334 RepID=A0A432ZY36_9FUNG|nr:hypothetical protein BC936DRAFT_144162 [Jimgerdemannia flammicorona]
MEKDKGDYYLRTWRRGRLIDSDSLTVTRNSRILQPSEVKKPAPKVAAPKKATPPSEAQGNALRIVIPVAILGAWLAYRFFA